MEQSPTKAKAPVSAHAQIDIVADEREVWTVIADIASWPTWNPAVREAVFEAELEAGARFRFSTVFGSMKCRLTEVDVPHTLSWQGRLMAMRQRQTWRIEPRQEGEGTHVTTDATMTGLGARLFTVRLNGRLQGELDALVHLLKLEAEVRSTEGREDEERAAEAARRAEAHE